MRDRQDRRLSGGRYRSWFRTDSLVDGAGLEADLAVHAGRLRDGVVRGGVARHRFFRVAAEVNETGEGEECTRKALHNALVSYVCVAEPLTPSDRLGLVAVFEQIPCVILRSRLCISCHLRTLSLRLCMHSKWHVKAHTPSGWKLTERDRSQLRRAVIV